MLVMPDTPRIEPRFARIAACIGDPTRSRMLAVLLDGARLPAGEIARSAGVNASTASEHLAKLVHEGLVVVEPLGRHRYYRVADADVARALEALAVVAERSHDDTRWRRDAYRPLKYARTCYRHLAGELGVRLFNALVRDRCVVAVENGYAVTDRGRAWLQDLGLDPGPVLRGPRYAYPCLDWSERREHLAGRLATALLDQFMDNGWLMRRSGSRALTLTPRGQRSLLPRL
jgi:DNA-binding transcriptional ArsR family regulator